MAKSEPGALPPGTYVLRELKVRWGEQVRLDGIFTVLRALPNITPSPGGFTLHVLERKNSNEERHDATF